MHVHVQSVRHLSPSWAQVTGLLNGYLSKFRITQVFDDEEVAHW